MAGKWKTLPQETRPPPDEWAPESPALYSSALNRRSQAFLSRLRHAMEALPLVAVQTMHPHELPAMLGAGVGMGLTESFLCLHVCLPPSTLDDGKRLIVVIDRHDYAPNLGLGWRERRDSSYYMAWDSEPLVYSRKMHWKNCDAAIAGITEWVLGSIYIPGPE